MAFFVNENQVCAKIRKEFEIEYQKKLSDSEKRFSDLQMSLDETVVDGEFVDICKQLNLTFQIWVQKLESQTKSILIDKNDAEEMLWKKCKERTCISGTAMSYRTRKIITSESIENYKGKLTKGVLLKYILNKPHFDEIVVMHPDIGKDPILIGHKKYDGSIYSFKLMEWD